MEYNEDGSQEYPVNVHRASEDFMTLERYDETTRKWVYNPGLIAATGMGGDHSYKEVPEKVALQYIRSI